MLSMRLFTFILLLSVVQVPSGLSIVEECQACQCIAVRLSVLHLLLLTHRKDSSRRQYICILVASQRLHFTLISGENAFCVPLQKELIYRISAEKHKDPLDLRNRLDSQGKRYGKIINFK